MIARFARRAAASALIVALAWLIAGCPRVVFDGPPDLEAGTGQYTFEPVEPGAMLPIVFGPQGGTHVWVSVRVRNLEPRNLHLETNVFVVETGAAIGERFYFDVNLVPSGEGDGYWIYAGLPVQVWPDDVRDVLIRVEVEAVDRDGRMAFDSMEIVPQ